MSLALVHSRARAGVDAPLVRVEVHLSGGLPATQIVGLAETSVRESRERVRAALLCARFDFPQRRITLNLAPADLPKEGGRYDLAIALGILAASGQVDPQSLLQYEFLGELGLTGELRPVAGALPAAIAAAEAGRILVVPPGNAAEAALAEHADVRVARTLLECCAGLGNPRLLPPVERVDTTPLPLPDLADVRGQAHARRALEVAAAGGHHLLLIGSPGCGKTLLASRLPSLLPDTEEAEALQLAAIASVSGEGLDPRRWRQRPFRSPHHSASAAALVGGGNPPCPGEISLAHHGVLFLDELPEWNRSALETLREPLESGHIRIARAARSVQYPARFQLVAAMNPCPCTRNMLGSEGTRNVRDGLLAVLEQIPWPGLGVNHGAETAEVGLPVLFWSDNSPWREVNLWISQKRGVKGATLKSLMTHLLAYAKWLEETDTHWWHFPVNRAERCLVLYRAFLVREIDTRSIKPRTAAARMRAIVQFYRWAHTHRVISPDWPMWEDRHVGVRISTNFGFERTISKLSTDLRIRATSSTSSIALEDNLVPVSADAQAAIQAYAHRYGTEELQMFLSIGFRTGLRLGTISDLKVQTLCRATPDPNMTGFMRISIGPGAQPPVATKNGVNGTIPMHRDDLDALIEYATSTKRLKRQARADDQHRDLIFLTKSGHPYAGNAGPNEYRALEMEISRLRSRARKELFTPMYQFKFHRTRATFGTNTARIFLKHLSVPDALSLLRDLMLHSDIATTLKYVKFIQTGDLLSSLSDEYTQSYLKLTDAGKEI